MNEEKLADALTTAFVSALKDGLLEPAKLSDGIRYPRFKIKRSAFGDLSCTSIISCAHAYLHCLATGRTGFPSAAGLATASSPSASGSAAVSAPATGAVRDRDKDADADTYASMASQPATETKAKVPSGAEIESESGSFALPLSVFDYDGAEASASSPASASASGAPHAPTQAPSQPHAGAGAQPVKEKYKRRLVAKQKAIERERAKQTQAQAQADTQAHAEAKAEATETEAETLSIGADPKTAKAELEAKGTKFLIDHAGMRALCRRWAKCVVDVMLNTDFGKRRLRLHAHVPDDSFLGLEAYSHVWLIFVFHANISTGFNSKVTPPRLGERVGVFASRSPHRLNPIGLSVAKLERVEGNVLHLSGVDLIDGTPILDVKPYHPADCIPTARTAQWIEMPEKKLPVTVTFTSAAEEQLRHCADKLDFYSNYADIHAAITQTLELDPRSIHSRSKHKRGLYGLAIDRIDVIFTMENVHTEHDAVADGESKGKDGKAPASASAPNGVHSPVPFASDAAGGSARVTSNSVLATVMKVVYFAPGQPRPRTRTKEWHEATLKELGLAAADHDAE